PGTTLAGALSQPSSDGLDRTWRCAPVTGGGTCTLPPATSLPKGTSTALQLLVRATGTGAVLPARLALRATAAGVEVATTTATLDSAAATTDLLLDVTPPSALQPGARGRVALLVTSLGAAALGPVVVTDVLPVGLQLLAARGSGWGCADDTCRWTGAAVASGASLPLLELDVRAPGAPTAAPLHWRPTATGTDTAGVVRTASADSQLPVTAAVRPTASLAAALEGPPSVPAGGSTSVRLQVGGQGLDDPALRLVVSAPLPDGLSLGGAVPGWSCDDARGTLRCSRPGDLGSDGSTTVQVPLHLASSVSGPLQVAFSVAVDGGPASPPSTVTLVAVPRDRAVADLVAGRLAGRTVVPLAGGQALPLVGGRAVQSTLELVDRGNVALQPGSTAVVTVHAPPGVDLTGGVRSGARGTWSCMRSTSVRTVGQGSEARPARDLVCRSVLDKAVPLDARGVPLVLSATALTVAAGRDTWPVDLSFTEPRASVQPAVAAAALTVDVSYLAGQLEGSFRLLAPGRPSVPALAGFRVANAGTQPVSGWSLVVLPPVGGSVRPAASGCRLAASTAGLLPPPVVASPVVCTGGALAPGRAVQRAVGVRRDRAGTTPFPLRAVLVSPDAVRGRPAVRTPLTGEARFLAPLAVSGTAVPARVVSARSGGAATTVSLVADVSGALDPVFRWRQLVTRGAPLVRVTGSGKVAQFATPSVKHAVRLQFEVVATDGRFRSVGRTSVVVDPAAAPTTSTSTGWDGKRVAASGSQGLRVAPMVPGAPVAAGPAAVVPVPAPAARSAVPSRRPASLLAAPLTGVPCLDLRYDFGGDGGPAAGAPFSNQGDRGPTVVHPDSIVDGLGNDITSTFTCALGTRDLGGGTWYTVDGAAVANTSDPSGQVVLAAEHLGLTLKAGTYIRYGTGGGTAFYTLGVVKPPRPGVGTPAAPSVTAVTTAAQPGGRGPQHLLRASGPTWDNRTAAADVRPLLTVSPTTYRWWSCTATQTLADCRTTLANRRDQTGADYLPGDDDAGRSLWPVATATNSTTSGGTPLTSAQTEVEAAAGTFVSDPYVAEDPAVSYDAAGQPVYVTSSAQTVPATAVLTASAPVVRSAGVLAPTTYQWLRCQVGAVPPTGCALVQGATAARYPVTVADDGSQLAVTTTTARVGGTAAVTTRSAGTVESVGLSVAGEVTGSPTPRPGDIVTARVTGVTRAGQPLAGSLLTYQWLRCTTTCTPVPGATGASSTLTLADVGTQPTVRVTATSGSLSGTVDLVAVDAGLPVRVGPGVPPPTSPAFVDGVVAGPGSVLTGVPATYVTQVTVTGRWVRCTSAAAVLLDAARGSTPEGCVDVTGTPSVRPGALEHVADAADYAAGRLLFVSDGSVAFPGTGTLHDYTVATTTPAVLAAPGPALVTAPSSSPASPVRPGTVLSPTAGVWAAFPAVAAHVPVWQRCALDAPATCADLVVDGAPVTGPYTVVPADVGGSLRLRDTVVAAADPASTATAYSALVTVTAVTLTQVTAPTTGLSGLQAPVVGTPLTGTPGTYSEPGATLVASWLSCLGTDCQTRVTGLTYTPGLDDVGRSLVLQVEVSALGATLTARSAGTGLVVAAEAPVVVTTDLANDVGTVLAGKPLVVRGAAAGTGPFRYVWARGGGAAGFTAAGAVLTVAAPADGSSGASTFTLTATDALGRTGSRSVTVAYGPGAPPALLCGLATAVRNLQGFDLGGGIVLEVTSGTVSLGPCTGATTVSLQGSATLFGRISIASLSASADVSALTMSAGQLSFPGDPALAGVVLPLSGSLTVGLAAGSARTVSGTLTAGDLPLPGALQLPGAWTAGARLTLSSDGGVQSVGLSVAAYDATDGASTEEDDDGLPVAPEGAPRLSLLGSYGTDGALSFSLTATGVVRFADSGLDVAGTVEREAGGTAVVTASGELAAPVDLGRGVTLERAALAWSGSRFSGSGAVTVRTPGTAVLRGSVAFAFSDPRSWSLAVTGSASDLDLVPGLSLGGAALSGTLSRSPAGTAFGLTVAVSQATLTGISEVTLSALRLGISGTCPAARTTSPSPGCAAVLTVSGSVAVTAGGSTVRAGLTGQVDTAAGTVALRTTTLGAVRLPGGVDLGSTRFSLDYGPAPTTGPVEGRAPPAGAKQLRVEVAGSSTINGTLVSAVVRFGTAGYLVAFSLDAFTPFSGAPTISDAGLRLSSYDTTITFGGRTERLKAGELRLFGRVAAPAWFASAVGRDDLGSAYLTGTLVLGGTSADLTARFTFPKVDLVSTGAGDLSLDSVAIRISLQSGGVTVGVSAPTTLLVAPAQGAAEPQALQLALTATYAPASQTLRGELSLTSATGWQDAFGVSGLVVHDLTVAIGIVFGTGIPTPSLGFAGSVELPPGIADPIGLVPGTPVTLVANIDLANPCFAIELGRGASTTPVLDVAHLGLVTANHAQLVIAPTGCEVGRYRYPAGLTVHFDGAVAAVPVSADLTLTTSPLTVKADIDVGAFALGPLTVDRTHLRLEKVSDGVTLQLEGGVQAFGVTAQVQGEFTLTAGRRVLDLHGQFTTPDLGGFRVEELSVDFHAEGTSISAHASLALDVLGSPQTAELSFRIANGRFDEARATVHLRAPLDVGGGSLALSGDFDLLLRTGQAPDLTFAGSATADGRTLAAVSGRVGPSGISLTARVDVPDVFSATLSGAVAYSSPGADAAPLQVLDREGTLVDAAPGDFRFAATDVQLGLAGFTAGADVVVGHVDGETWGDVSVDLHLGLGEVAAGIELDGSFSSDGDFSLAGSGSATVAGFPLPTLQFAVAKSGGELTLEASATASVPGVFDVALNGQFSRTAAYGTLFRFVGSAQLTVGDYQLGAAKVALFRDVAVRGADPGTATTAGTPLAPASCSGGCVYRTGLLADGTLSVPNLARATVHVALSSDGSAAFSADLAVGGDLASVLGTVDAHVAFDKPARGPATLRFSVVVRDALGIPGFLLVSGSFSTGGSYSLTAALSYGPVSGSLDLGLVEVGVTASGSFAVSVSGGSGPPAVNVAFAGSGSLQYKPLLGSWTTLLGVRLAANLDPPKLTVGFTLLGGDYAIDV
ncbi:MAG: hypothetical protein JWM64_1537, partial [Frankiales bacterium]|nr:hypothetical protein [Frankiales bacterium]